MRDIDDGQMFKSPSFQHRHHAGFEQLAKAFVKGHPMKVEWPSANPLYWPLLDVDLAVVHSDS